MAWVCFLTSWWTHVTDTTVPSWWSTEQHDPNFTLPNLPFGWLQLVECFYSDTTAVQRSTIWQWSFQNHIILFMLCMVRLNLVMLGCRYKSYFACICNVQTTKLLILRNTEVRLGDHDKSTFETTNLHRQIMGELWWLALSGITMFATVSAKMVMVGSGGATSIVCVCVFAL